MLICKMPRKLLITQIARWLVQAAIIHLSKAILVKHNLILTLLTEITKML